MTPAAAIPVFLVSIGVMLAASAVFARRLDHIGLRLGLPEALLGLLTALAADAPELASAVTALVQNRARDRGRRRRRRERLQPRGDARPQRRRHRAVRARHETLELEAFVGLWLIGVATRGRRRRPRQHGRSACSSPSSRCRTSRSSPRGRGSPGGCASAARSRASSSGASANRTAACSRSTPGARRLRLVGRPARRPLPDRRRQRRRRAGGDRARRTRGRCREALVGVDRPRDPDEPARTRGRASASACSGRGSALMSETLNSNSINVVAGVAFPAALGSLAAFSGLDDLRPRLAPRDDCGCARPVREARRRAAERAGASSSSSTPCSVVGAAQR